MVWKIFTDTFSHVIWLYFSLIFSGSGGMADTRDPEAYEDADPRKSIKEAPSFEEYMKQRDAGN